MIKVDAIIEHFQDKADAQGYFEKSPGLSDKSQNYHRGKKEAYTSVVKLLTAIWEIEKNEAKSPMAG